MMIPLDGPGTPVIFQYNPSEVGGPVAEADYATMGVGGRELPYLQYSHGKESAITFELIAAKSMSGAEVSGMHKALQSLTKPFKKGVGPGNPPRVMLILGGLMRETVVVKSVQPKFRRFHTPDLVPNEARFQVTLWKWSG
jgi:hypothetical protein